MTMPFISSHEGKNVHLNSFVALPLMKYRFFTSLIEINVIYSFQIFEYPLCITVKPV